MLALTVALAIAGQPLAGGSAWLLSTIGESEWCPAGNVRIDLESGRYLLVRRAARTICNDSQVRRPVEHSRLSGPRLGTVQSAYRKALATGFVSRECMEHLPPKTVVVMSPRILVAADNRTITSAPDDLSCWSDAANALHELLNQEFERGPRP